MIGHYYEGVKSILAQNGGAVVNRLHDHSRDRRLAQIEGSASGFVKQSIHQSKCLTGGEGVARENSLQRQAIVQTPGEEHRLVRHVEVRKPATVKRHARMVRRAL